MTRRAGITLVEVLVAIFIMAIGLLALLTLFPIGMLRMAQAIRDSRSAQSGQNGHNLSIMHDIRNDPLVISDPLRGIPDLFVNPYPLNAVGLPGLPNADPYGESYPIFVDPIGYGAAAGASQDWVGGAPGFLCRRPVQFTGGVPLNIYRNFTLWDDMAFDGGGNSPAGTPQLTPGPGFLVKRDTRYSWAYLFRRPQTQDRSIVDCSVIVFDQRPLSLTNSLTLEEYVYTGNTATGNPVTTFNPANNTISIDYSSSPVPPPVRPGDWLLDVTFYPRPGGKGAANGFFYRVVGAEELGNSVARYEVHNPIRGYPASNTPAGGTYSGTVIVIRGIAEVMEKGPVRLP